MEPDDNEYLAITYMFLKQGKWKTKTEIIDSIDTLKYEKHRILNTMPMNEYYSMMDKV